MSHHFSDPAQNPQFRRNRGDARTGVKFLAELGDDDLDRLAIERGVQIVRRLPKALVAGLKLNELLDLARAFGRPWLRRMHEQRRELRILGASSCLGRGTAGLR